MFDNGKINTGQAYFIKQKIVSNYRGLPTLAFHIGILSSALAYFTSVFGMGTGGTIPE